jgi:5-methylthioadenosine/S-adenosylhomocysteine deaminase
LVEPGLSPHAPYTVSQRLYRELARYARRNGVRLATHVAESRAEVELLERGTGAIAAAYKAAQLWKGQRWSPPGVSPVSFLERADALGPEMLAVHCVQLERDDVNILAGSGAAVAHCPRSNTRLQCGAAPIAELRAAGVLTGLGTDSLASNDSLDLFAEMRAAIEASRARAAAALGGRSGAASRTAADPFASASAWGDSPEALDEETVLRMATLEGAAALGLADRLGSLEQGKQADIVAVRLRDDASVDALGAGFASPVAAPVAAVVNGATPADIRMTMVAGRVAFECSDGPLAPDDLDRAFAVVGRKLHAEG